MQCGISGDEDVGGARHGFRDDPLIVRVGDAQAQVLPRGFHDHLITEQGFDLVDSSLRELQLGAKLAPELADYHFL